MVPNWTFSDFFFSNCFLGAAKNWCGPFSLCSESIARVGRNPNPVFPGPKTRFVFEKPYLNLDVLEQHFRWKINLSPLSAVWNCGLSPDPGFSNINLVFRSGKTGFFRHAQSTRNIMKRVHTKF